MKKKILIIIAAILIIMQFSTIDKNVNGSTTNFIGNKYTIPTEVKSILDKACMNCHSNNSTYPWYVNIQPIGFWIQHHINEGKSEINFDEFLSYAPKKAHHKLEECIEMVKEGEMPLKSYTFIHRNAKLTLEEKLALSAWASTLMKQIETENNVELKKH